MFCFIYLYLILLTDVENVSYKTEFRSLILIGRAAFEAIVNYITNLHLCLLCVLLGNHFVPTTTVSEELHLLFLWISLHLFALFYFVKPYQGPVYTSAFLF